MPKLRPVDDAELKDVIDKAQDASAHAHEIERRLNSAGSLQLTEPLNAASAVLSASRTLADLAHKLMVSAAMSETQSTLVRKFEERKARGEP